jgi:PHP family Zn ribbon phosphoesterase
MNEEITRMNFEETLFSDLHIHSRFSRACSKDITLQNLVRWARIKGLNLLGTGDFTHPVWFKEIKEKLTDDGKGFYYLDDFPFIITGEVSLIYTQRNSGSEVRGGRRIHLLLLIPDIETAEKINSYFDTKGRRDYDGRPIFNIPGDALVRDLMNISKDIEIIPAHVWTPWFGVFGSMTGFDSLKECFGSEYENIHAIETGMSCYDGETEILTEDGWKKFLEVSYFDKVCTLDINSNKIEFQKPIEIQKYDYKGKMYRLKTKRVDLLVTPNHNFLVSHCDFRKEPSFSLKKAEDIFNKSKRLKKDGIWIGDNEEYFILPAVKIKHGSRYYSGFREKQKRKFLIKDWLKFFGFWIAEGWVTHEKNGNRYGVYVCNKNREIIIQIKKILQNFGYNPYEYINGGIHTLRVSDFQLYSYLKQFGKCCEKLIPSEIKKLSKNLLEIFLEYYIKGDGHVYGRTLKGLSATTTSIKLRDDLQEIALKLGMSAYYKLHNRRGKSFNSPRYNRQYKQREDSWNIYFIKRNLHTIMPSTIKRSRNYSESWVDFDGEVYCVSVPNRTLYVRRNGIPVWCGNSDPEMNWRIRELEEKSIVSFSDSHSFWPYRLGREATIFRKADSYKELIEQIRSNTFVATVETDPAYGKYHWDGHRLCGFSCSPEESKKLDNICPKCNRALTIGVENRVEQLASHALGFKAKNAKPFYKILPLHEIIALAAGISMQSKKVWEMYNSLISAYGNEFNILLRTSREELISKGLDAKLADLILKNREGKIKVKPGYDGVYGEAMLGEKQVTLFS